MAAAQELVRVSAQESEDHDILAPVGDAVSPPIPIDNLGTWTFTIENDWFASTDQDYTSGLRLSYISGTKDPTGIERAIARFFEREDYGAVVRRGFAVGHSIFTPRDTLAFEPLPDQHPYAGFLYGEYAVLVEQTNTIDVITAQLGLVGPDAGGEWFQNSFHDLIDGEEVNGWDNQIGNEVIVNLSYDRQMRAARPVAKQRYSVDFMPSYGVSVGNRNTNARVGATVRFGKDLRRDYGPPRVRPSLAGAGFFTPRKEFSWYIFGGAQVRAVAHDIFLDGRLGRDDDPQVEDRNVFVGDAQIGLVGQYDRMQVAYTYVYRSEEFETQDGGQQFGALSVSWKF